MPERLARVFRPAEPAAAASARTARCVPPSRSAPRRLRPPVPLPGSVASSAKQAAVVAPHPGVDQPRAPARQHRSARPHAAAAAAGARPGLFRPVAPRDLDTEFFTGSRTDGGAERDDAAATSSRSCSTSTPAPSARSSRTCPTPRSGCGCRMSSRRAACSTLQCRGAAQHPVAADRRRGARALPAHQVRRSEALLARGRGCAHPARSMI